MSMTQKEVTEGVLDRYVTKSVFEKILWLLVIRVKDVSYDIQYFWWETSSCLETLLTSDRNPNF